MALVGMKIVRRNFGWRNGLPPIGYKAFYSAARDFHDKTSAMPIELNRKEIDAVRMRPPEMRKRAEESSRAQGWYEGVLQCDINGIAQRQRNT